MLVGMWDVGHLASDACSTSGSTWPLLFNYVYILPPMLILFCTSYTCCKYYIKSKESWHREGGVGLDVGCGPIGLGCMLH